MADLLPTLIFYLFAAVTVFSGVMVITAKNPVHSVFFLILAFFNSAGLFVLLGAEFIAMILIIVYVGAVAVLFLFVIMMLDIDFVELRAGFLRYLPVGAAVALALFAELVMVFCLSLKHPAALSPLRQAIPDATQISNTQAIGDVLYTWYFYPFQLSGIILLIAMIGAITLTLRARPGVRKQHIGRQLDRKREDTLEIVKVEPGRGI